MPLVLWARAAEMTEPERSADFARRMFELETPMRAEGVSDGLLFCDEGRKLEAPALSP